MAPGIRDMQLTSISGQKYSILNAEDEPRDLEASPLLLSTSSSDGEGERNLENRKGLEKLEVKVIGMTCAACSNSVEKALLNLARVYTASIALLQNKADVSYDPSKVKERKARELILADRYDVDAWDILANEAQHLRPIYEATPIYEQLLAIFPTIEKYWKLYVEAQMVATTDDATKQIFSRCLLSCLHVGLW